MAVPEAGAVVGARVKNEFAARNWRGPGQTDVRGHFCRMILGPCVVPRNRVSDCLSFPESLAVHHVRDVHDNFSDIIIGIIGRDKAETFVHVETLDLADPGAGHVWRSVLHRPVEDRRRGVPRWWGAPPEQGRARGAT